MGHFFELLEDAGTFLEDAGSSLRMLVREAPWSKAPAPFHSYFSAGVVPTLERHVSLSAHTDHQSAQADPHCRATHYCPCKTAFVEQALDFSSIHPGLGKGRGELSYSTLSLLQLQTPSKAETRLYGCLPQHDG